MPRITLPAAGAATLILCAAAPPEGWTVDVPDGATETSEDGAATYTIEGEGALTFYPATQTPIALPLKAAAFIEEVIQSQGGRIVESESVPMAFKGAAPGQLDVVMIEDEAGVMRLHTYLFRPVGDQLAVAGIVSDDAENATPLLPALLGARFGGARGVIASEAERGTRREARRAEATERAPAAPSFSKGGLSGLYSSSGTRTQMGAGGYAMSMVTNDTYSFSPDGWMAKERSGEDGQVTDCSARPRPNRPRPDACRRYEVKGGKVRYQTGKDKWHSDGFMPFETTAKGFDFGSKSFVLVGDLTGMRIAGRYVGQSSVSAGGGPGSGGSAAGFAASEFAFQKDGRFTRRRSSAMIAAVPGAGGGSGSSEGRAAGRYAFEGNMLVLTYEDGTTQSTLVRAGDEGWERGDPAPRFLTIGGLLHGLEG